MAKLALNTMFKVYPFLLGQEAIQIIFLTLLAQRILIMKYLFLSKPLLLPQLLILLNPLLLLFLNQPFDNRKPKLEESKVFLALSMLGVLYVNDIGVINHYVKEMVEEFHLPALLPVVELVALSYQREIVKSLNVLVIIDKSSWNKVFPGVWAWNVNLNAVGSMKI